MDVRSWMERFERELRGLFGERLVFAGLQGSRARGEAGPDSDIDVVVILDRLDMEDLRAYDGMLAGLPHRELVCGFISGRRELENWERSDLLTLCLDTLPVYGDLDFVRSRLTDADARRAVRIGAGNLYHGAVHNLLHDRSMEVLKGLYKSAAFALRTARFAETGTYVRDSEALAAELDGLARRVMLDAIALRKGARAEDFDGLSERLIALGSELLERYGRSEA